MPRPVSVAIDIPQLPDHVFAFLDVMANHQQFTDHLLTNWRLSGPATGVGSATRVDARAMGVSDTIDIEVIAVDPPYRLVERNIAQKSGRVAEGTYELKPLDAGGTHVTFTYTWKHAPLPERVLGPLLRSYIRKANATALRRLAFALEQNSSAAGEHR